jgi:Arc/MetJ family transcription regulator
MMGGRSGACRGTQMIGALRLRGEADVRTTLNIDDEALTTAMKYADGRTKTEVINEALRDFARRRRMRELLAWRGKIAWEGDLDALRGRE